MSTSGYSGTPLGKKLGIKPGAVVRLINQPEYYFSLFADFPEDARVSHDLKEKKNVIHYFTRDKEELLNKLPELKKELYPDGMIWISWPKKTAKITTDLTEDVIRSIALGTGLVDVKVCAIDEVWSGLKLVIPVKDRK
jgi:hypothetical protein